MDVNFLVTSMGNLLNRIKKFVKENTQTVTVVVVVIFVILVGIFLYFYFKGENTVVYTSPLGNETESSNDWEDVRIKTEVGDLSGEYMTYSGEVYDFDRVSVILGLLGFEYNNYEDDGGEYYWNFAGTGYSTYISDDGLFNISTTGFSHQDYDVDPKQDEKLLNVTEDFISNIFDINQPFELEISSYDSNQTIIQGNYLFGENSSVSVNGDDYMITFVVDSDGDILNISLPLIEFSESDKVTVPEFSKLFPYLKKESYPKESIVQVTSYDCDDEEHCYPNEIAATSFDSASIEEVDLLYYIDMEDSSKVFPIYLLTGTGAYLPGNGSSYPLSVKILMNAVDPSQIIVK